MSRAGASLCEEAGPEQTPEQTTEAEQRDVGFLTRMIEDNLNSVGRTVTIDGFDGALSSTATIVRMTIADAQGVWFVAENMRLNWNVQRKTMRAW